MNGIKAKVWAVLLTVTMMIGISGCGEGTADTGSSGEGGSQEQTASGSEDVPTVTYSMLNAYDISDIDTVEAAINDIIVERYGIKLHLNYCEMGNWAQQANMLLSGDETDLIILYGSTPLITYVKNGQILALDDYFANSSDEFKEAFYEVCTDEDLRCMTIDGKLYGVANSGGDDIVLNIDENIAQEFGIEPMQKMTLDDIDVFLEKAHEAYPDRYAIMPQSGTTMMNARPYWDGLGDNKMIGVIPFYGDDYTVQNIFEMDEFKEFCSYTREWYEKGYMMADCMSNTEMADGLIRSGKAICSFNNGAFVNEENFHKDGFITALLDGPKADTTAVSGICWGINANSKNPDAAWKMMEIMYCDEEVIKLLVNGVEGVHYVVNDDGTASFPEGKDQTNNGYGAMAEEFLFPGRALSYPRQELGASYYADRKVFCDSCEKNAAYGMFFDSSTVTDEYSACCNVMDKYYAALMLGAVSLDDVSEQATEELKAAGLDKVIEEKQRQLDAWLETYGK